MDKAVTESTRAPSRHKLFLGNALYPTLPSLILAPNFKMSISCIGEKYPMHVKEPTSLLAMSRETFREKWPDST